MHAHSICYAKWSTFIEIFKSILFHFKTERTMNAIHSAISNGIIKFLCNIAFWPIDIHIECKPIDITLVYARPNHNKSLFLYPWMSVCTCVCGAMKWRSAHFYYINNVPSVQPNRLRFIFSSSSLFLYALLRNPTNKGAYSIEIWYPTVLEIVPCCACHCVVSGNIDSFWFVSGMWFFGWVFCFLLLLLLILLHSFLIPNSSYVISKRIRNAISSFHLLRLPLRPLWTNEIDDW